jgi:acetyl esterase/lipase
MSILAHPRLAAAAARSLQLALVGARALRPRASELYLRWPNYPRLTRALLIPTSIAPAPALVYSPARALNPPVHVNFHGGGFVMPQLGFDDPLCRYLAAEAGAVVLDVDYAVAPQFPFPAPPQQAYEVVQWVAAHGGEQGWDASRLTVGGQSAGGALAAAVARLALERGGPALALQVLHYPPLDLLTPIRHKRARIAKPRLRPWMGDVFDNAYAPRAADRGDRLISPAHPSDTADLRGIARALIVTAADDLLQAEGQRYAERLRDAGALIAYHEVRGADHAYDVRDPELARQTYALIAQLLKRAIAG